MIDAGSRNNAIEELINEGNKLCPKFFPTILPPLFNLLRPIDLFNADVINNNFPDLFLTPARFSTTISHSKMEIIITKITPTNELDSKLSSPKHIMAELLSCNFEEFSIMSTRLSELNGYSIYDDASVQRKRFSKIYHLVYAIRTLMSFQGFKVFLGPYVLPFKEVSPAVLEAVQALLVENEAESDSGDANANKDVSIIQDGVMKKKGSKRKRSKA